MAATKDLDTPVRQITFNEQGDPSYETFFLQIQNGKEVPVQ